MNSNSAKGLSTKATQKGTKGGRRPRARRTVAMVEPVFPPEVMPAETMTWHCCDCHANFDGPTDRPPANGCSKCGSRNIFDVNITRLDPEEEREALRLFALGHGRKL